MHQFNSSHHGTRNTDALQGAPLQYRISAFLASQQQARQPIRRRPRIGVLSSSGSMRDGGWPVYAGDAATINAIFEAGGYPVIIPTLPLIQGYDPFNILTDDEAFDEVFRSIWPMLRNLDGLLLTGGGDLYSCFYGHVVHPQTGNPELWRDIWERYFALMAWILCIPTLGICRGMQVMNVVRGGGLFQDIRAQWPRHMPPLMPHRARGRISADNWVEHPIIVHPKSKLASIIRGRDERVPYRQYIDAVLSMHHQIVGYLTPQAEVVGYLAPTLGVGATAPDGVIEAIEDLDPHRYWVAVQFHPEWVVYLGWALRLFSSLVEAASAYATLPQDMTDPLYSEIRDWVRRNDHTLTHQQPPETQPMTTRSHTFEQNVLVPLTLEESL